MGKRRTIGEVSRQLGVASKTLRFYEAEGIIAPPAGTETGYRLYTTADVRRLRLARRARLLGLSLPEVKVFVERAFTSDCAEFADMLLVRVAAQREAIARRIAELRTLRAELDELERHVRHDQTNTLPGQCVDECQFCPLIDEEGGD